MRRILHGARCLIRGFNLIRQPGLRRYAIVPIFINVVVYAMVGWLLVAQFDHWLERDTLLANWQHLWLVRFLTDTLTFLLGAGFLLIALYTFTFVANLLGAPFNGLLAEKVEARLRGDTAMLETSWISVLKSVPRTLASELRKWLHILFWLLLIGLFHVIPGLNLIAPLLLLLFGVWVFALEYLDYPMGNHGHGFKAVRQFARQHRWAALGFGVATALIALIPILNLIVMPVAVAGATVFYVDHETPGSG